MAYKVYLTVELPGEYTQREVAQLAAIHALRTTVAVAKVNTELNYISGRAVQARVFESEGAVLSGHPHAFIVDICDGCM